MRLFAVLVLGAALAAPGSALASPGRISVGLEPGADATSVTAQVVVATGGTHIPGLAPLRALVVSVPDVEAALPAARGVQGVAFAEPVLATRSISFAPNDPLAGPEHQWYLEAIRAFDFWAGFTAPPPLPPVLVAVIDSGIDATNPEFAGRIEAMRTFVRSRANVDSFGHGTMIAGEIAAALDNGRGIAGVAFPGKLLIAKVVRKTGSIPLDAEARAIRWAVDRGASVINLSLGGPRNPTNPMLDTYSELERSAIDYATRHGVVIVAAAGNCAAICPESYANYPAALPHVIGVGATTRGATTPRFSNRDAVHLDLAAPGTGIVSTLPLAFTDASCSEPGTTVCALDAEDRNPKGTSFSAPLVSAAAALALAQARPFSLRPGQLATILARAARDIGEPGHDSRSGYGLLNVDETIRRLGSPPARDQLEPNDDTSSRAATLRGPRRILRPTLARYEDGRDVYRIELRAGELGIFTLRSPRRSNADLALWRPYTKKLDGAPGTARLASSTATRTRDAIVFRAPRTGWYFLEVKLTRGRGGSYGLTVLKP
ncbi:MAG TPA: S8 family serine peptidase [Gaiellaceae bacterium]|nr:S8 family serine peptidase [Gaiellaceae bacterium]